MAKVTEQAAACKQRLQNGEALLGCFLSMGSAETAEVIGLAGYDFAVIDLEHGAGDEGTARLEMQALAGTACLSVVRVESAARQRVHRVLDAGAHGVMFPRIDSAAEAAAAAAAMRYPPHGVRGVAGLVRASHYGADFSSYMAETGDLLTIVQIESPAAVENAEEISAVEGVDVLFVGPYDLTCSLGIMGQMDHPRLLEAVKRVSAAAAKHNKTAGILIPPVHDVPHYHALGYRFLMSGSDLGLIQQGARSAAKLLREQRTNCS